MINVKPIALEQVRWAIRACEEKRGIEFIVNCFNACIERGEMNLTFHLPAGEYRRYAHLLADLVEIERQIENILQGRDPLTGHPMLNEEDDREWSGESIERDHAEALAMNDARNTLYVYAPGDAARDVWEQMTPIEQAVSVELRHAEALAFNAEVDEVAAADQWDEWANQHDSRKTKAQMIESDHAEALEMEARRNLIARQARFVFHNTAAERAQAIEEAHDEALALNAKYNRAAMKKKTVDFVFSGVSGRAQVDGKSILIHWAGQVFYLAAAAAAMRAHVIKQLSIAGAL